MARPQVATGGDRLQIWTVAVNTLNKQSRTADRGWSSSLVVRRGASNHHRKTPDLLCNVLKSLGPGRILWKNDPNAEKWMRFGTRNVRSLCRIGSLKTAARELGKYKLNLVRVQEVRWEKCGTERAKD
jgi:hypothetical protein